MITFQKTYDHTGAALDSCGIGRDVGQQFSKGHQLISAAAARFILAAGDQLTYNLLTNIPCGVDIGGDPIEHAVTLGLVHTITSRAEYSVSEARRMAADILEDVNDHTMAAFLRKKADELNAEFLELCGSRAELDLHWTPATLGEIKATRKG